MLSCLSPLRLGSSKSSASSAPNEMMGASELLTVRLHSETSLSKSDFASSVGDVVHGRLLLCLRIVQAFMTEDMGKSEAVEAIAAAEGSSPKAVW